MRRLLALLLFGCLFITAAFAAERPQRVSPASKPVASAVPAILSIIPAQCEPGQNVIIFGSGFGENGSVFLGSMEITAKNVTNKQIEFTIPAQIQPGIYALFVRRADGTVSRTYNFTVIPLRPVLNSLSPEQISSCAQDRDREITAQGHNFTENSLVLFDGAVIRSRFASPESLVFTVPQITGGLHQVQVKNYPETASLPVALTIETKPEINQVTVGDEHVNYYELLVDGKNFQQGSSLYVDGQRIGGRGGQEVAEREKLIFQDCGRLIYQRFPYSPVSKDFRIQVVNPGGESSRTVMVTAP